MSASASGTDILPGPRPKSTAWLLVYVNLMTLLMIFFMVLYAAESVGQNYGKEVEFEKIIGALEKVFGGLPNKARMARAERRDAEAETALGFGRDLAGTAKIELSRNRIRMTLPSPVLFDSGSAELKPFGRRHVAALAGKLARLEKNQIVIEGHTDDVPISKGSAFTDNFDLSAQRALSIVRCLTESGEISPERLIPVGYGRYRPVASNSSAEDRAKNRRIEIHIIRER